MMTLGYVYIQMLITHSGTILGINQSIFSPSYLHDWKQKATITSVTNLVIKVAVFPEMLENFPRLSVAFFLNELNHRHQHAGTSKHTRVKWE